MVKLEVTNAAYNFITDKNLPLKYYKQITTKIFSLLKNPIPQDSKDLKGYNFKRVDIGEYRIIYRIEDDCLFIELIGSSNDDAVYAQLKRRI
ncbi:MAG: type II toxin-antitoxin system RelE/ParE family toxin [Nitrospirae bacterium]|nr:type II toxin-antitoxin system RelE/ParE family toxin [Nitrospirota bacterium]